MDRCKDRRKLKMNKKILIGSMLILSLMIALIIFVLATGTTAGVQEGMIIAFNSTDIPEEWINYTGFGGYYLVGAGDLYVIGNIYGSTQHRHAYTSAGGGCNLLTSYPRYFALTVPTGSRVPGGTGTVGGGYTNYVSNSPPYLVRTLIQASKTSALPIGAELWWAGDIGDIPKDFEINTEILNKYLVAVGGAYDFGETGGSTTHTDTGTASGTWNLQGGVVIGGAGGTGGVSGTWSGTVNGGTQNSLPLSLGLIPIRAKKTSGVYTDMVLMYYGGIDDLSDDYELYSDTVNKFIIGAGDTYDVGEEIGSNTHTPTGGAGGSGTVGAGSTLTAGSDFGNIVTVSASANFLSGNNMPLSKAVYFVRKK